MNLGNWVPMDKGLLKHLPCDREYSPVEAAYSLQVDYDCTRNASVSGYSKLWGWSRKKVRTFLKNMSVEIVYPGGKMSPKGGQVGLQVGDKQGNKLRTSMGQARLVNSRYLHDTGDKQGTSEGQVGLQVGDKQGNTTKDPNPKPDPKTEKELVPPGKDPVKPSRQIPYKKIIETLNEKTGKSFLHTTKSTQHMIRARFSEKFIFDDFVAVIEHMAFQWSGDDKMNQYLRPQTLFGTKFEGYLQDSRAGKIERKKSEWIKN